MTANIEKLVDKTTEIIGEAIKQIQELTLEHPEDAAQILMESILNLMREAAGAAWTLEIITKADKNTKTLLNDRFMNVFHDEIRRFQYKYGGKYQ